MYTSNIKKVAIVGPESTGKTTLAEALAARFETVWVPEYAREYLGNLTRPYREDDLLRIALGQRAAEDRLLAEAQDVLICDTTPLVTEVWSRVKYGRCDEEIVTLATSATYDLYLLTHPDIPWEPDPLREHPNDRRKLLVCYQSLLYQRGIPFTSIRGPKNLRKTIAVGEIMSLLRGNSRFI